MFKFSDVWQDFQTRVMPDDVHVSQIEGSKAAFYCGGYAVFQGLMNISDDSGSEQLIQSISDELEKELELMQQQAMQHRDCH